MIEARHEYEDLRDDEPIDYIRQHHTRRQAYFAKAQVIRERFGDEAADNYLAIRARIAE